MQPLPATVWRRMSAPVRTIPLWRDLLPTRGLQVGTFRRLSRTAVRVWQGVANSRPLAWLTFLALYTVPTIVLARQKLLWDDEFFTLYLSTTKNWTELIKA